MFQVAHEYDAKATVIIDVGKHHRFETVDDCVHFAPYLSEDPEDGFDHWYPIGLISHDKFPVIKYRDHKH